MPTDPHEESLTKDQQEPKRISRRQFRKERKRTARKASRQHYAQQRDQRQKANEEQALNEHANYLQQKRLWEEREQRYEIINSVKRKAEEAERAAREAAKQKWRDTLLRMPMLPPTMTSTFTNNNTNSNSKNQANIRNMPTFVSTKEHKEKKQLASTDIDGDTMNWP